MILVLLIPHSPLCLSAHSHYVHPYCIFFRLNHLQLYYLHTVLSKTTTYTIINSPPHNDISVRKCNLLMRFIRISPALCYVESFPVNPCKRHKSTIFSHYALSLSVSNLANIVSMYKRNHNSILMIT